MKRMKWAALLAIIAVMILACTMAMADQGSTGAGAGSVMPSGITINATRGQTVNILVWGNYDTNAADDLNAALNCQWINKNTGDEISSIRWSYYSYQKVKVTSGASWLKASFSGTSLVWNTKTNNTSTKARTGSIKVTDARGTVITLKITQIPMAKMSSVSKSDSNATVTAKKHSGIYGYAFYNVKESSSTPTFTNADMTYQATSTSNKKKFSIKSSTNGYFFFKVRPVVKCGSKKVQGPFSSNYVKVKAVKSGSVTPPSTGTKYRAYLVGEYTYNTCHTNDVSAFKSLLGNLATPYSVSTSNNPTKSQLLAGIRSTFSGADNDDVSLFYFSGHGENITGSLCTSEGGRITTSELYQALNAVPGKVIVVLENCFSGQAIRSAGQKVDLTRIFAQAPDIHDYWSEPANVMPSYGELRTSKFVVIAAAAYYEECWYVWYLNNINYSSRGAMTYALLLGGGWDLINRRACSAYADTNSDKKVTLNEAYTWTYCKTMEQAQEIGEIQHVTVYPENSNYVLFHLK